MDGIMSASANHIQRKEEGEGGGGFNMGGIGDSHTLNKLPSRMRPHLLSNFIF